MSLPTIAIVDWKTGPLGEPSSEVESSVAGDDAHIHYQLADTEDDLDETTLQADAIILWHNLPITSQTIDRLSRCRAIIRNGVGFDSIDLAAAKSRRISICNVPDYGTEEVADHAIALALTLCRQIASLDSTAKALKWNIAAPDRLRRFSAMVFGIVGLGPIGTAAAMRAKALGFQVAYYDPYVLPGVAKALGIRRVKELSELLRMSDVLSLHCPLNQHTLHLISETEIGLMKPHAYIVNTARGALIKKAALFHALREGRIAGAGLDVVEDEPLRTLEEAQTPNLIVTCHAAFCSRESKVELRSSSARLAVASIKGEPLENIVNR